MRGQYGSKALKKVGLVNSICFEVFVCFYY